MDNLLRLVYEGRVDDLLNLATFVPVPCRFGYAFVPCPAGMPEGTVVQAFLAGSCSVNYVSTIEDVKQELARIPKTLQVYGIHSPPARPTGLITTPYVMQLVDPARPFPSTKLYADEQGKLLGVAFCGECWPCEPGARVVLAPRNTP